MYIIFTVDIFSVKYNEQIVMLIFLTVLKLKFNFDLIFASRRLRARYIDHYA